MAGQDPSLTSGFVASTIALVRPTLEAHGTPAQQERYLPPLVRGDEVWCQLFSEPGAGSDLAALRTRAARDGDEWVVNGQKVWTSGAQHADFAILIARTDADVPKHRGITYFVLDMHSPGVEVRPLRQIDGAAEFNEVFLTDVRVPHENVVGEVNGGWAVAHTTLANESMMIGSSDGVRGDVDALICLARETDVGSDPLLRQRITDAYIRSRVLGFLGDRVETAASRGERPGPDGSVLKLLWAEAGARAAETGVAAQGPLGMLFEDAPQRGYWQRQLLRQFHWRIGGGTEQIHRNMIGERMLGLPAEPRVDKDVSFREVVRSG
jgi:alkylation response protein AidB-like acyl-CoA dehydrogenase